jgi:hypothetical protein
MNDGPLTLQPTARQLRSMRRAEKEQRAHPNYFAIVVDTPGRTYLFEFGNPLCKAGFSTVEVRCRSNRRHAMYRKL